MERLNHLEPLRHVPTQATLTPATTSQRRLRRSVFQAIALPLLSLGVLSSCSDQAIKPASGEPTDSAVSALTTCAANTMLTDSMGATAVSDTLPTGYIMTTRPQAAVGVNYWSGDGVGLINDSNGNSLTGSTNMQGNMPVRRFPGGLGGTWNWHSQTGIDHPKALTDFLIQAHTEGVKRLFFVVNTNGAFRLNQKGNINDSQSPIPGEPACHASYNWANCLAAMAADAKLFANEVVTQINTNWGANTTSWPEIVFEIGNEYPLLARNYIGKTPCTATTCQAPTYDKYADVFAAYRTEMQKTAVANSVTFKYAVAGLFPEHGSGSIWEAIKIRNPSPPYDYRVIHDYGFAPEVNGQNGWAADCQTMIPNGQTSQDWPTVYGLAEFSPVLGSSTPVVITEFGTPDGHCNQSPCSATCVPTVITATEAVLNDSLLATKRMNIPGSDILSVNLKWPAKANAVTGTDPDQTGRSWQHPSSEATLPVYSLYQMMGSFLNAQPVSVPGQVGSYSGLRRATAANGSKRFAVYTNLTSTKFWVTATVSSTVGTPAPSLAGIKGNWNKSSTAALTTTAECNTTLNSTSPPTLTFGIAANSVVVVTY